MEFELKKNLTKHELGGLARLAGNQEGDIALADLGFDARLELLLEELICERENKLINRLIEAAPFKYPMASIESLGFDARQVKKNTAINPAAMGFVATATNLIINRPGRCWQNLSSMCVGNWGMQKNLQGFLHPNA